MFRSLFAGTAALALGVATCGPASAELLIAPTRLNLTQDTRSGEIVLVNKSTETAAFRISLENRRMGTDGSMELAETPRADEKFAADLLRLTPRQLTMQPGERQVVRVSARDTGGLAPGEYRAHMRLMSAPLSEASAAPADAGDNSLAIQLVAIRSLTIPVILRVGTLDATAMVEKAGIAATDTDLLRVTLARKGTRSTYGDLKFFVEGETEPVYFVRGVAVYVPNTSRDVLVRLPAEIRAKLEGRRMRVDYVSTDPAEPGTVASLTTQL